MQPALPTEEWSLAKLESACRAETQRFRSLGHSDTRFCLEIFKRALQVQAQASGALTKSGIGVPVYADEDPRTLLVQIYTDFIKAQINRSALPPALFEELVQQVWLRFWQAANAGLTFATLQAALTYLKLTTVSALLYERRRERQRQRDTSLQELDEVGGEELRAEPSDEPFAQYARGRFRTRCREVLTDPLEHRIFWMRYSNGLPPREIARELVKAAVQINNRPATPRSVSNLIERSCKRLELDPEIRALLTSD